MSGIDKIMAHLNADCDAECKAIAENAELKIKAIYDEAELKGDQRRKEIISAAEKQAAETVRLAKSTAEMKNRQSLLAGRVNLLKKVLADALSQLNALSGKEYWDVLTKLAVENAQSGDGVILVSVTDSAIMPSDFVKNINDNKKSEGTLSVRVSETLNDKGIILVYGDIEINLTFKALIEADEDELKETAQKILFK